MAFDAGEVSVLVRQGGQYAAGAVSVLVVLGSIDADTAKGAVDAIGQVVDGLSQATAGIGKLVAVIGPVIGGALAWYAKIRSSVTSKIADVKSAASDPTRPSSADASAALKLAAASLPGTLVVSGTASYPKELADKIAAIPEAATIIATPSIASATASPKVVSQ